MIVYKITNKINGKVYIGQTIRPIEQRYKRHINDAMNNVLNTHFARAIRKYGQENFICEQIDTANTQEELTNKEQYWIRYYDSVNEGYNETDAITKCGGNTYLSKTDEEMKSISEKIRLGKLGKRNPNSKSVKCYNIEINKEIFFETIKDCQEYFGEKYHRFITTRVLKQTLSLYKGIWKIAYKDNDYGFFTRGVKRKRLNKCVSTISDECKRVETEIGTVSKRKTTP